MRKYDPIMNIKLEHSAYESVEPPVADH